MSKKLSALIILISLITASCDKGRVTERKANNSKKDISKTEQDLNQDENSTPKAPNNTPSLVTELDEVVITTLTQQKVKTYLAELKASRTEQVEGSILARPAQCSLAGDTSGRYTSLLDKVKAIENSLSSKCKEENENLSTNLTGFATEINTLAANQSTDPTAENAALIEANTISAISSLASLAEKDQCFYDIKKNGLLPIMAEIIKDVSSVGLAVPSATGIGIAVGGAVISMSLELFHTIFQKRFDFDKSSDRNEFIALNCAYYDIQQEIFKSGMLHKSGPEDKIEMERIKAKYKIEKKLLSDINAEIDKNSKELELGLFANLQVELGYDAHLNQFLKALTKLSKVKIEISSPTYYTDYTNHLEAILTLEGLILDIAVESDSADPKLKKALDYIKKDAIAKLIDQNQDGIVKLGRLYQYQGSLVAYVSPVILGLDAAEKNIIAEFKTENNVGYAVLSSSKSLQAKLKITYDYICSRYDFLKAIDGRSYEESAKEESSQVFEILEGYEKVNRFIYGKFGKQFSKKLTRKAYKDLKDFKKKYSKSAVKHIADFKEGKLNARRACQDLTSTMVDWKKSVALKNTIVSFYETNYFLFNSFIRERIVLLPFLPSAARRLQIEALSVETAKAIIANRNLKSEEVNRMIETDIKKKSIGRIMLDIQDIDSGTNAKFVDFSIAQEILTNKCGLNKLVK